MPLRRENPPGQVHAVLGGATLGQGNYEQHPDRNLDTYHKKACPLLDAPMNKHTFYTYLFFLAF